MMKNIKSFLALLLCVILAFSFGGCSSDKVETPENEETTEEKSTEPSESLSITTDDKLSDDIISPDNDVQTGESTSQADLGQEVDIFLTNKYYLEGTVYSGSDSMPVKLATDGKNLQFTTDFTVDQSKIVYGLIVLDDVTYVTLPSQKKYTKLSQELLGMMDMDDVINATEFQTIKDGEDEQGEVTQYKVTVDGKDGLCTTYTFKDTRIDLYSIGDKLVQIDNFDEKGVKTMIIDVDNISAQIPSDQLTLNGLEEVGAASFFSALMSSAAGV